MLTRKQQQIIRSHYGWWRLRFARNGDVWAQQRPGAAWGWLYTAEEARKHIEAVESKSEG